MPNNSHKKGLYQILKGKGFLFPTSEEELIEFEKQNLISDENPPHWDNPFQIILNGEVSAKDLVVHSIVSTSDSQVENLAMAARSGNAISKEVRSKMNEDRKNAEKE